MILTSVAHMVTFTLKIPSQQYTSIGSASRVCRVTIFPISFTVSMHPVDVTTNPRSNLSVTKAETGPMLDHS